MSNIVTSAAFLSLIVFYFPPLAEQTSANIMPRLSSVQGQMWPSGGSRIVFFFSFLFSVFLFFLFLFIFFNNGLSISQGAHISGRLITQEEEEEGRRRKRRRKEGAVGNQSKTSLELSHVH